MSEMRFVLFLLAGVALALIATPGAAQDGANALPAVGEDQRPRKARALAELMTPTALMVESNMKAWEAGIQAAIDADPSTQKLEAAYPGIIAASIEAARPVGRRYCKRYVKLMSEHKAGLIAAQMSLAEIDEAIGLYGRPSWRRFVTRMAGNVKMDRVAKDSAASVRETGKPGLTKDGIGATLNDAARTAGEQTSGEDQIELMRLSRSAFMPKIKAIAVESDRQSLAWANNPEPAVLAEQKNAMQAAMIAFVDARKK